MRKIAIITAVAFTLLPLAGFAQQGPETVGSTAPNPTVGGPPPATGASPSTSDVAPQVGGPLLPGTDTGLDKVADDGVSTKTVKAVPCTTAARETDGSTTCVGIPSNPGKR